MLQEEDVERCMKANPPKRPSESIRVPAGKQTARNSNQIIEDWHPNGQHKRRRIHQKDQHHPDSPSNHGVRMQMLRLPEKPHKQQLCCGVAIQAARDQEIRYRDRVRRLLPIVRQTRERRGRDRGTDVNIQHHSEDDVKHRRESLQDPRRAHGLRGVLHLGDEDEEHVMPSESKDRVRDADKSGGEICRFDERVRRKGKADPRADHPHDARDEDADDGGDGQPGEVVERAGQGKQEGWDGEDACVEHEAELFVAQGGEGDLSGEELSAG